MALQDADMATDTLGMLKRRCLDLTWAGIECSDGNLRQAMIQMRTFTEQVQWELYRLMEQKGWYLPSGKADHSEVQRVRQFYQGIPAEVGTAYVPDGGGLGT